MLLPVALSFPPISRVFDREKLLIMQRDMTSDDKYNFNRIMVSDNSSRKSVRLIKHGLEDTYSLRMFVVMWCFVVECGVVQNGGM
jgi:hypothetical protein